MYLTDREAIIELMATYANALDTKNYDEISACFFDDATADYVGFTDPLVGADEILPHMRRSLDPLDASQHLFSNFIVSIDGDSAKLRCDILAQHIRKGSEGPNSFMAGGKYEVILIKADSRWKFRSITARSSWSQGDRTMLPSTT